ncbi:hypothetical protein CSA37_13020 [Candidatus Fermentibacteria bacterium]|nr:MAG: hypothetical protein CSA37_13020 [Candidatus Fermentibacteria bacterium]
MSKTLFPLVIFLIFCFAPTIALAQVEEELAAETDTLASDSAAVDSTAMAEEETIEEETPADTAASAEVIEEDPPEEIKGGFFSDVATFFRQGGPAMWAILGFFGVGIVITIERLIFLFGVAQSHPERIMARIAGLIRKGSIEGAIAAVSEEQAPLARIIEAALRNYKGTERDIQNAVDEMALAELPRINARIGFLAMLANVSTMVGLLGTIFGLIAAFAAVAAADPEQKSVLLANGISQAMNTTAFGLISAIPLLIIHSILTSKSDSLVDEIDRYSVMVINMLAQARKEG